MHIRKAMKIAISILIRKINSESEFEKILSTTSNPVVAYFRNMHCTPCRLQEPIIDECAKLWGQQVAVLKVDVDDLSALAIRLRITGIPSIIFFKDGVEINRFAGVQAKQTLITALADSVLTIKHQGQPHNERNV